MGRSSGSPIVDAVEEKAEGAVGLRTEGDFRSEDEDLALPVVRLECADSVLQVTLTPGPAAPQRIGRVVPADGPDPLGLGTRREREGR